MKRVDLTRGPIVLATLGEPSAIELRCEHVEADEVEAALVELRHLRGLKALRLRSRLRALPVALLELRGLQQLEICDSELPGLPADFHRLSRLRSLRLELFRLASLPRGIGGLTRLRELYIDSHHLVGLPDGLREIQELRELTLLLRGVCVPDWEHPGYFCARFRQPIAELFTLLAGLPALSSLTIGEPDNWASTMVFERLPEELAGLRALESLTIDHRYRRVELPPGVELPGVRRLAGANCLVPEEQVRAMFPNAELA